MVKGTRGAKFNVPTSGRYKHVDGKVHRAAEQAVRKTPGTVWTPAMEGCVDVAIDAVVESNILPPYNASEFDHIDVETGKAVNPEDMTNEDRFEALQTYVLVMSAKQHKEIEAQADEAPDEASDGDAELLAAFNADMEAEIEFDAAIKAGDSDADDDETKAYLRSITTDSMRRDGQRWYSPITPA